MTTAKEIPPITTRLVSRLASQRSAHGCRSRNRSSCILTRGPNRSKAATVTGTSSELAQGQEMSGMWTVRLCERERRIGDTTDNMSSIYDNEKEKSTEFLGMYWDCERKEFVEITEKNQIAILDGF